MQDLRLELIDAAPQNRARLDSDALYSMTKLVTNPSVSFPPAFHFGSRPLLWKQAPAGGHSCPPCHYLMRLGVLLVLQLLPLLCVLQPDQVKSFIQTWGTHFVSQVSLGGLWAATASWDSRSESGMSASDWDTQLGEYAVL